MSSHSYPLFHTPFLNGGGLFFPYLYFKLKHATGVRTIDVRITDNGVWCLSTDAG